MKNRCNYAVPAVRLAGRLVRDVAATSLMMTALVMAAGCSSKPEDSTATTGTGVHNVTLTAAQREHIRLYTVAASKFHKTIEITGVVDFDNEHATAVLTPISGPVSKLLVDIGDRVKKGDPLAIVDSPDFAAAISAYRKALTTAHTARRLADLEKDLVQHQGVAQREEDQAETDAANADADRDAALKALISLNVDAQTIKAVEEGKPISPIEGFIRSPITGTVVDKQITPGQLLQAGTTPAFTVANLSRVWVMAQVPESDLQAIGIGDTADIVTAAQSKSVAGTVSNISALVNPDTRLVAARVVVDNPDAILKKQMYVDVAIHARQESNGLLVPVSAILRDDENLPFVYLAQRDGSFARRPVTVGYRTGDRFDIASGLQAGEQVVVDGGIFVQFMQDQ
jgi:cobalt-zinc-cadmium efflux system membrane fusion protein